MSSRDAKVVVITGASSGIGREAACQFAARGASVVLAARNEEALAVTAEEVAQAGGTPFVVPTDVAEWPQVQALAAATDQRFGRIDTWVNNATVSGFGELAALPVEAIERIVQVDLVGQIYGVKAVLPIMRAQGYGTIIGIVSGLGVRSRAADEPDHGENNLWNPHPGPGAVRGTSIKVTLRRSQWARIVGYHPTATRAFAAAAAAAVAWRVRRR